MVKETELVRERETDMVREMRGDGDIWRKMEDDGDSEINNVPSVIGRCGPNSVRL
jgi:hypothetical protein